MASRDGLSQPATAAGDDHPLRRLRRHRGLTQVELAGLAGLSYSYISMIERGQRTRNRRDHVNALAAALRVPPAHIAPSMSPGFDEWAPALPAPASAFPPLSDDIAVAQHRELVAQFISRVSRGDTYAAGGVAAPPGPRPEREPLAAAGPAHRAGHDPARPAFASARGERDAPGIRQQRRTGAGWLNALGEITMCGTIGTVWQASMGGHPRPAGGRTATRIPPLPGSHGDDVTARWPRRSFLELAALPSAVPCARLHTRHLCWEWQLTGLSQDAELVVSEVMTNAIQITQADERTAPVRLWLLGDRARLLILVWDASPLPPVPVNTSDEAENGRGLLLVDTLSTRWGHFLHQNGGKVVWSLLDTT
jgi:transcriptional regulator with XRE-family HTH domain